MMLLTFPTFLDLEYSLEEKFIKQGIDPSEFIAAKIHCIFVSTVHIKTCKPTTCLDTCKILKISDGRLLSNSKASLLKEVIKQLSKIVERNDPYRQMDKLFFDVFLKTINEEIAWIHNCRINNENFEVLSPLKSAMFLDEYTNLQNLQAKAFLGLDVLQVLDKHGQFTEHSGTHRQYLDIKISPILCEEEEEEEKHSSKRQKIIEKTSSVITKNFPSIESLDKEKIEIIESRMYPGKWSEVGFLHPNQSLMNIYEKDKATLEKNKISFLEIADFLSNFLSELDTKVGSDHSTQHTFNSYIIEKEESKGAQECPFSKNRAEDCADGAGSSVYTLIHKETKETLTIASLMPHLIKHGFFQGGHYRLDPERVILLMKDLNPN